MIDPAGRSALVTGGARRVGAAMTLALAASGVDVAIHHRSLADDAEALAAECREIAAPLMAALVAAGLADGGN